MAWVVPVFSLFSCGGLWLIFTPLTPSAMILSLMGVTLFNSTFYVTVWAVSISMTLTRVREQGIYEQLSVLPRGALGANWALCISNLHHNDTLHLLNVLRKITLVLLLCVFFLLLMAAVLATAPRQISFDLVQFLRLLLDMMTLTAASYFDHVQSILMGSLIGMLVPLVVRTPVDARIWPALIFLTLQMMTVLVMLLVALVIIPAVHQAVSSPDWFVQLSPPVLNLLVFYLLRESIILILWRVLVYRLNAEASELQL